MNSSRWLEQPVSAYSIGWFRIVLGAAFCFEVVNLWWHGNIKSQFVDSVFQFKYPGFEWVVDLPSPLIHLLFLIVLCSGFLVMIGAWYRPAIITLFLSWSYLFFLDQCNYMNHYYLMVLLPMVMIFIPADRVLSFSDSLNREKKIQQQSDRVPRWCLLLLQFQLAVPYFFGAIYKMHSDWLIKCEPMQDWLTTAAGTPLVGKWLTSDIAAYGFSWGGMLFDLLIVPALMMKRTRTVAVIAYVGFHLINTQMHSIGLFPWLMLGALPVFLSPDLIERLVTPKNENREAFQIKPKLPWVVWVFIAIQLITPVRHWAYPGWVLWNDRGSFFAWNMRPKRVLSGREFMVVDHQVKAQWAMDIDELLTPFQKQRFNRPEMYRQLALGYQRLYKLKNKRDVEVYLAAFRGLNGREPIRLVDQTRDLTETDFWDPSWILPFQESKYPFDLEDTEQFSSATVQ